MVLERISGIYAKPGKLSNRLRDLVRATNVFTTHTPVPAGNDEFPIWLVDKYFANFWPSWA